MVRSFAAAAALCCLISFAWAQTQSTPGSVAPAAKPVVKKSTQKAKAGTDARPPVGPEGGRCQIGVLPALGDRLVVQKVGITVFGNERTEVPVDWSLDDLVVARVRAAAAGSAVRRISFAKDAFTGHLRSGGLQFGTARTDLNDTVRRVVGGTSCERYVLVTNLAAQFYGNQSVDGVGIVNQGAGFLTHTYVFAAIYVWILDGQSFEVIKRERPQSRFMNPVDEAVFPSTPADAAKSSALRDSVRGWLATSLDSGLPKLLGP
ncbi:MAG: hypothetical protein ACXWMT_12080 [Candidatus Binataceae bacterium]